MSITVVEKQEGISNDYTENLHIFLLMTKNMTKRSSGRRGGGCLGTNG